MNDTIRIIIAISVILVLLATFIITFILYKKTPVPKGCEVNSENCKNCDMQCHLNIYQDRKEENK